MIDSHAHVAFYQFDEDREEVIKRAHESGVTGWIEVGTDLEQSRKAIELAQRIENVWPTVGVHPSDIEGLKEEDWTEIEKLLDHPKVVAVGEVGLDFYRGGSLERQLQMLQRFVDIALTRNLPVIFHVRSGNVLDAHDEMIKFLDSLKEKPRGVIHTYSGTLEQSKKYYF
jgi:TatD DNase family protein